MIEKEKIVKTLTVIYFVIAFFEVVAEYFINKSAIFLLKPMIPLLLIIIYYFESNSKNWVVILAIFLSLVTNVLFIPNTQEYLLCGLIAFTIHRIVVLYLIFTLQKIKDYIPAIIATAPFLLVFFYMFMETPDIPEKSIYILILQNILISIFAGVALSSYVMQDNKQNSLLLICALLFVMLQFTVFIEKYLLVNEFEEFFRPIAMSFNTLAFFSLYKYIVTAEKSA